MTSLNKSLNKIASLWPVIILNPKEQQFEVVASVIRNKGYIIFVNPETKDCEDEVIDRVNTLQSKQYWNLRSKFKPEHFKNIILWILMWNYNSFRQ